MSRAVTLAEIASWVDGRVVGDSSLSVRDALPLQDADSDAITLVDNVRHLQRFDASRAIAAIAPLNFDATTHKTLLHVAAPHRAFEAIVERLRPAHNRTNCGVHPQACVDTSATIGPGSVVHAGAMIGEDVVLGSGCTIHSGVSILAGCQVGDHCTIFPNAVLYPGTVLGDRVLIHSGAILGAYGFGYRFVNGGHQRTPQLGWVQVGNDVELGACTTIDRGTYGATRIGDGTKIDNQVQIGHNCQIGRHNLICALVGVAGSSTTGDYVVIAGQVGIKDHIDVADHVTIGAQSGVMDHIPAGETWLGTPAIPHKQAMLLYATQPRISEMRKQLRDMQRQIEALTDSIDATTCDTEFKRLDKAA